MFEAIDDWEQCDYTNLNFKNEAVPTDEQLKQIEVQKLVEESEKALIDELFDEPANIQPTINIPSSTNIQSSTNIHSNINKQQHTTITNIDKYNRKIEHELKQKARAKSAKDLKLKQQRDAEVYGESVEIYKYDKYNEYTRKFF